MNAALTAVAAAQPRFRAAQGIGYYGTGSPGLQFPVDVGVTRAGEVVVLNRSCSWDHPHPRLTVISPDLEHIVAEVRAFGTEPGQLFAPAGLAVDGQDRFYVTDDELHRVTVLDRDGQCLGHWGAHGAGPGQFDRPAGIAVDGDHVWVVDQGNSRVQRFTTGGVFLDAFGSPGAGPGEFDNPWGIAVGPEGDLWIADWRNDRVQRVDARGRHLATYGTGLLTRPAGLAVDVGGACHVADWGADCVRIFGRGGGVVTFLGAAPLTTWGSLYLEVYTRTAALRERALAWLGDVEPRLLRPCGLCAGPEGTIVVADTQRHRIQVYEFT